MRSRFKGFYDLTTKEEKAIFNSKDTIFVFDTNCFFNLYRCEEDSRQVFINVLEKIEDRLWFPFQVCLEYQRNRLSTIQSSLNELKSIDADFRNIVDQLNKLCSDKGNIKKKYQNLHGELCKLRNGVKNDLEDFITKNIEPRISENDYIFNTDEIRNWIDEISKDKIGEQLTQKEVDEINTEGEKRYKNKIGPGWGDEKKEKEHCFNGIYYKGKFGDLYLWKELLKKVSNKKIKNVIFITNDAKDDWWYKLEKIIEPLGSLEILKTEITSNGADTFKMYTQSSFLLAAKNFIKDAEISDSSITEFEYLNDNTNDYTSLVKSIYDQLDECEYPFTEFLEANPSLLSYIFERDHFKRSFISKNNNSDWKAILEFINNDSSYCLDESTKVKNLNYYNVSSRYRLKILRTEINIIHKKIKELRDSNISENDCQIEDLIIKLEHKINELKQLEKLLE